jgi:galactokinase/mevalonate kinase-like predicted kinase
MKNNSFDTAMEKIVGQAHAEQQRELAAQARRKEFAKMKTIAWSASGAVLLVLALCHLSELQNLVTNQLAKKPATSATSNGQIDQIQQAADKRDAIVGEITK